MPIFYAVRYVPSGGNRPVTFGIAWEVTKKPGPLCSLDAGLRQSPQQAKEPGIFILNTSGKKIRRTTFARECCIFASLAQEPKDARVAAVCTVGGNLF
jgi:hypothetical protein